MDRCVVGWFDLFGGTPASARETRALPDATRIASARL
jgi:hypothetical protein